MIWMAVCRLAESACADLRGLISLWCVVQQLVFHQLFFERIAGNAENGGSFALVTLAARHDVGNDGGFGFINDHAEDVGSLAFFAKMAVVIIEALVNGTTDGAFVIHGRTIAG